MTDLSSLIERLERATGPDRELDALIAVSVRVCDPTCTYDAKDDCLFWYENHGEIGLEPCKQELDRYTSSLDAALTLVPEHMYYKIERYSDGCYAVVSNTSGDGLVSPWRGSQKPAPIALCIASLRARSAGDGA